jgi:hypothetical protein
VGSNTRREMCISYGVTMTVGIELLCLSTITKVFSYFSGACNCFSLEANGNSIWKIILKKNKQIDFCRTTCFQYTTDYITGTKSFFYKDTFVAIENFFAPNGQRSRRQNEFASI